MEEEYYSDLAYKEKREKRGNQRSLKNRLRIRFYRWLIKKYLKDCKSVLDIGCGNSLFLREAKKLNKEIKGIDIAYSNPKLNIEKKDYLDANGKYDAVFSSNFLEHVDQFEFMKKVREICNKKIITIAPRPSYKFWNVPSHIRPYTIIAIKKLYLLYGFNPIFSINLYPTKSIIVIGVRNWQKK